MIVCPSCKNKEYEGALFCSECGAQLNYLEVSPTDTFLYSNSSLLREMPGEPQTVQPPYSTVAQVLLKILDTGQVIPLEGGEEFTLGRVSGSQPILPDVDLTPFQAYEAGVSRLHATIKIQEGQITITDLGSANGTRLNGKKLPAHESRELKDTDILTLGKFKIQVMVRN